MSTNRQPELIIPESPDFDKVLSNPILDIAARVWDRERYEAFRVCYKSMRIIDDLVDDRKATGLSLDRGEQAQIANLMNHWVENISQKRPTDSLQSELVDVMDRFKIPCWPWQRLARAMIYDLSHNGYQSFGAFLRYSEGAAIAPASIFMHLCGVSKVDGQWQEPVFDIRKAARRLALFSYLVHIVRDFKKDQQSHLNYIADDILAQNNLSRADLTEISKTGRLTSAFRQLVGQYVHLIDHYRQGARKDIDRIGPCLERPYRLSLEIVYDLYLQIRERIKPSEEGFDIAQLLPQEAEISDRLSQVIARHKDSWLDNS